MKFVFNTMSETEDFIDFINLIYLLWFFRAKSKHCKCSVS